MSLSQNISPKVVREPRSTRLTPSALLALAGLILATGYMLHMFGFSGWLTLLVAAACLLVAHCGVIHPDFRYPRLWLPLKALSCAP